MAFAKISQVVIMCQSKWLQIMIWLRLWIPMMSGFQVGREYIEDISQNRIY